MKYWPNGRSRWLKIDSSPVVKTTRSMRTKNAEKIIFKKKEANIQPFDQKSLLLHVLFGRGPNKVMETACFDVTAVNLKKVGMASRNIVVKKQYTLLWISFTVIPAAPSFPRSDPRALALFLPWMANSRDWQGGQMPRSSPGGWAQLELTDALSLWTSCLSFDANVQ